MQHGNRYEPVISDKNMADEEMTERRQGGDKSRAKGFGEELRAAREAQGISLGDMAVRSRLSVAQLRALENEEVEKLPEPVYVRAFIRGCAQSLGLDGQALVNDYVARFSRGGGQIARGQVPDADPNDELVIGGAPRHRTLKIALLAVLVLAVGAGIWAVYSDQFNLANGENEAQKIELGVPEGNEKAAGAQATTDPTSEPTQNAAEKNTGEANGQKSAEPTQPTQAASQPAATPLQTQQTQTQQPTAQPAQSAQSAQSAPAAAAQTTQSAQSAQPASEPAPAQPALHRVEFEITSPVWIQVISPEGRNLVAREMHPGDRFSTDIPTGSRFTIGNADAVKLVIDGSPFSLEGTIRNGISRFSIE